jgi:hypothetical protein
MPASSRNYGSVGNMTDDLPRTLRREREAQERAGRPFQALGPSGPAPAPQSSIGYVPEPTVPTGLEMTGGTVTDIRIPFFRLMVFCIKLVFAAIPGLILLGVLLWTIGHLLMTFLPWLVKLQILIRVPG